MVVSAVIIPIVLVCGFFGNSGIGFGDFAVFLRGVGVFSFGGKLLMTAGLLLGVSVYSSGGLCGGAMNSVLV